MAGTPLETASQISGNNAGAVNAGAINAIDAVKEVIAQQTGYATDMLEETLDLEADLGIDTVKQVEIFAKIASTFGFSVPDDLKLRDLNTIEKLGSYVAARGDIPVVAPVDTSGIVDTVAPEATVPIPTAASPSHALETVNAVNDEQTGYA